MAVRLVRYDNTLGGKDPRENPGVSLWHDFLCESFDYYQIQSRTEEVDSACSQADSFEYLKNRVSSCLTQGDFPIVISNNHSSAIGTINGALHAFPQGLGIVWVDAHTDIHSPWTSASGNLHGMPLAALMGMDHKDLARNSINQTQEEDWRALKNLRPTSHGLQPGDVFFVGIRDYEPEEEAILHRFSIRRLHAHDCRQISSSQALHQILENHTQRDRIFVSFDLDSLDPQHASGVSVPAERGLELNWTAHLLSQLISNPKVVGLELTEFNPELDRTDQTNQTCRALSHLIAESLLGKSMAKKKRPLSQEPLDSNPT